ncbi:MAG TPA: hypothetical protein VK843_13800 [Planctomycetota bacterium]|nr:hypothetical protein [Planctomycetota bacterium]
MKPLASALVAILVAIALWMAPLESSSRGAAGLRSDEGAYRMRLCELALTSGESLVHDRMLEPRAGVDLPYGPFATSASAFVLGRLLPRAALDVEQDNFDEDALADGAARLMLVLAWFAAIAMAWAGRRFLASEVAGARGWAFVGTSIAALAWAALALAPSMDGGSVRAPVWGLILVSINLGGAAALARPRELIDQLGIAIGVGAISGIALLNDPFVWPALLAPVFSLWLCVRGGEKRARRDALRSGIFFVASTLAVFGLRSTWPAGASPWPRFGPDWQLHSGVIADPCIQGMCILMIAWLVFAGRKSLACRALCAVLVASFVLRVIDPRFAAAPLAPAGCAFVAWADWLFAAETDRLFRRALGVGFAGLLCFAAALSEDSTYSKQMIQTLRELRTATVSSGAWNHPGAAQSYSILANPRAAGVIVFHARRPVCGGLLPGADVTPSARAAALAMLRWTQEDLLARMTELNALYVIATKRDGDRIEDLERVAAWPMPSPDHSIVGSGGDRSGEKGVDLLGADPIPGFELVRRVPAELDSWEHTEIAIWRLVAPLRESHPATLRAR